MTVEVRDRVRGVITDVHAHVTVPALIGSHGPLGRFGPDVQRVGARQSAVSLAGRPLDSIVDELSNLEIVLSESDERGVKHLVISPWIATIPRGMDSEAASDLCRAHNEAMANAGRQARGRVNALGAVPLDHPGRAAEVLAEAVGLGLAGVEIPPTTGDRWLGDDVLEPFWAAAEELRAIIFVHPSARGLGLDVFDDYYLWNSVANPMETTIAAAQLVMAGVLERHPDLVVVLAHAGGAIGSITGRLDHAWHVRREAGMRLREPPSSSIGRFRFDTVSHDAELLRALVGRVGADHVLLGSDRPFDMGRTDPVADVKALQLTAEDEALILGENTQALVAAVRGPRLELSPTNEGMSRF